MLGAADRLDAVFHPTTPTTRGGDPGLEARLRAIGDRLPSGALGVSVYDYLSGLSWGFNDDRWFHAASIIKLAVLVAVFDAAEQGRFMLGSRLHVRNRFLSVADGLPFRIDSARDNDLEVHAAIGRTMQVRKLARRMIITSSNLATNLLLNLVGLEAARESMRRLEIDGVDICRAVEDERAFEQGISNRMTPAGAIGLLRAIVAARGLSPESADEMSNILLDQQLKGTIGPGLARQHPVDRQDRAQDR